MKRRILTGLKPTSDQLHIGNYFGSIKPLFEMVEGDRDAEVFLMLASMHAFTTMHDGTNLAYNSMSVIKLYLAMMRAYGLEDDALFIFNPVDVPAHAQLARVLQCITHMGFMERMHAYKDAIAQKKAGEVSVGTFTYPILMAIDILLYDTNLVPVGKDQKQHVEYARDIAQKFNHLFGESFILPEPIIRETVATVIGTDGRKMSKSYNNFIGLLEDEASIRKKIARIPTAAIGIDEPKNPDEDNIYKLQALFLGPEEDVLLRNQYTHGGLSYKDAKNTLADTIIEFTKPIKEHYAAISDNEVRSLLARSAERCNEIGNKKVIDIYKKIGFTI